MHQWEEQRNVRVDVHLLLVYFDFTNECVDLKYIKCKILGQGPSFRHW